MHMHLPKKWILRYQWLPNVDELPIKVEFTFTYSVDFFPDSVEWKDRMRRYGISIVCLRIDEDHRRYIGYCIGYGFLCFGLTF
jgi:hypothetical protein